MENNYDNGWDLPVAVVFFARPDLLEVTFAEIKKAKPSKLFLIQDGARNNKVTDSVLIEECRRIVEDIDWKCEVFKNYSDSNLGCGMRVYSGLTWAFQHVDRLLVLEDDCVPSQSLFPFVVELLEKYKNDQRIGLICGMNNLGKYEDCNADYFFTTSGSIWGWATWKRVWDQVEYDMGFLQDKYAIHHVFNTDSKLKPMGEFLSSKLQKEGKLSSWSYQLGMSNFLNHQLNIVPKYNMISNIGMSENGANSVSSLKYMPKALRSLYYMKTYEYVDAIKHPKYIVNDLEYKKKLDRLMEGGHSIIQFYRKIESTIYRIFGGDHRSILKKFSQKLWK